MATTFKLDKKAFGIEVLCGEGMKREMERRARRVLDRAKATAPDSEDVRRYDDDYKDKFFIRTSVRTVPPYKTRRAVATVGNTSNHARDVEYGRGSTRKTVTTRASGLERYRVLGRALDAARS